MVDKSGFVYDKGQIAAKGEILSHQSRAMLTGMGMSLRGIQQLSLNQQISNPNDRAIVARLVREALK